MNDISMEYFYLSQSDIDTGIGMGTRYQKTYMDITKTLDEYAELYRQFVFKYGYYMFTTYEHARLTILSVIGKGAFGTVYIVRIFDSVYALKMEICNTTIYTDETFRAKIKKEYFLQKGLAHEEYSYRPYEYGVVQDPSMLFSYLLMEVGDFAVRPFGDYWKSVPADQFSPLFMTQLRKKLSLLFVMLRTSGLVHGDLHWNNLLVQLDEDHPDVFYLTVIDFGMSVPIDNMHYLKAYDVFTLYISTVSYPDIPPLRTMLRELLAISLQVPSSELVSVQKIYPWYHQMKQYLQTQLRWYERQDTSVITKKVNLSY